MPRDATRDASRREFLAVYRAAREGKPVEPAEVAGRDTTRGPAPA